MVREEERIIKYKKKKQTKLQYKDMNVKNKNE